MKLKLPEIDHVNFYPVEGIALFIDKISERPMHITNYDTKERSDGPKLIFTRSAVENSLPTLLGQGFCAQQAVAEHGVPRSNAGIVTEAWIDDNKLMVRGGIYGMHTHFPEVIAALEKGGLGLCPSFHDTLFDHKNLPEYITVRHTTFTGVNIIHSWATSFDNTKIWLTKRSYVAMTDTEDLENQRVQRATFLGA